MQKYLSQRRKHGYDQDFIEHLRTKFRGSPDYRYKCCIRLYPDKFELQDETIHVISTQYDWPEPVPELDVGVDGPSPYEKEDWRSVGLTAELVANICKLTGHPCAVLYNTTLI